MSYTSVTAYTDLTITDDDEIEPKFKYKRFKNGLEKILRNDVVTCAAVHPKFLILAGRMGRLYLLDHQGNTVDSYLNKSKLFSQPVAVNDISVDSKGEYVAICSDDGEVMIAGLFSDGNNQRIDVGNSVKAVALDPDHKVLAGKRFVVGDEKLKLYERNFLKNHKSSTLYDADGYVRSVCWNGRFLVWASYLGVGVYDSNEKCCLGLIKWEKPQNANLRDFRCNFRWSNATTLLIGWVDIVRICVIKKTKQSRFLIETVSTFQTSFYICGLAPLTTDQLVVLGFLKEKDSVRKALRPVLSVLEYTLNKSKEVCTNSLSVRGYKENRVNDYMLGCIIEENRYFIIAPKDLVIAYPLETEELVQWLIKHRKFQKAMDLISEHGGKISLFEVSRLYIDHLLSLKQFDDAAELCVRVFGNDNEFFEKEVSKFAQFQQLRSLSAFLPVQGDNQIDSKVYEMVLYEYMQFDLKGFLNVIKKWPKTLYDTTAVINAIYDNFHACNELYEALAILHTHQEKYESALSMYSRLENEDVFDTITMLIQKQNIPPENVVQQLEQNQVYLYKYLDSLNNGDSEKFHWKLLNLYAKFDRERLMPLLKRSNNYPIKEAFDVCKCMHFYPEMVYLLGRMGSTSEALDIIIHELNNIKLAIDFCKEYGDSDLWNKLIDESVENPVIMTTLINGIIGYVKPEALVNKIKLGQKIPGLKKSVMKMLIDYRLQLVILEDSNNIIYSDIFELQKKIVNSQRKAKFISYDKSCAHCKLAILRKHILRKNLVVFLCGHVFHEACLPDRILNDKKEDQCNICTN